MISWYLSGLVDGVKNLFYAIFHSIWGIVLLLVLVIGSQFLVIFVLAHQLEASMTKEIRDASAASDKIKQNLQFLHQDTGELRTALGLPPRTYPALESSVEESEDSEEETSRNNAHFFKAVERLLQHGEKTRKEKTFWTALDGKDIGEFLKRNGLTLRKMESGAAIEKDQKNYFTISTTSKSSYYQIKTPTGKSLVWEGRDPALLQFLEKETPQLSSHYLELASRRNYVLELLQAKDLQEKMRAKNLAVNPPTDSPDSVSFSIVLKKERSYPRIRIGVDKKDGGFFVGDRRCATREEFRAAVLSALDSADLRSQNELKIEDLKKQLLALSDDKGFRAFLESKKLKTASSFREDGEYVYFDFVDETGKRRGSFGIHKLRPEIYLMDEDDLSLGALKTINISNAADAKKKYGTADVPRLTNLYRNEFSHTYLLVGSHENLTDTIILAHIDEMKNGFTLISLPRDLYYKGKKINTLYPLYGGERFCSELSKITGLAIERYMVIDMYAFIDAVNILGGVDVTLEEDLIDPSYRVKEGGRWSTLFYKAGRYHLNGIETLRIARSRHFSSDFGRARRQQDIVESIKAKAATLGFSDLGKVYDLIKVLQKYVDTNMSAIEIAHALVKYGDMKVTSQHVIDTSNVLHHSYTNLIDTDLKEEKLDRGFDKGAYILLPKDNDWNYFRWYIRSLVEGPLK